MGRKGYPGEFRRRALALMEAGRKVKDLSEDLGVSEQTLYTWRRQARIDSGLEPGLTTTEKEELASANRRIRELEAELQVHRRATELLTGPPSFGTPTSWPGCARPSGRRSRTVAPARFGVPRMSAW